VLLGGTSGFKGCTIGVNFSAEVELLVCEQEDGMLRLLLFF
jgi:hypothetical protein